MQSAKLIEIFNARTVQFSKQRINGRQLIKNRKIARNRALETKIHRNNLLIL